MRLFRRGKIWYGQYYGPAGERIQRSTKCDDYRSAERKVRDWERCADTASDPAATATMSDALSLMIESREAEATSANWRESELARREDVSKDFRTVLLRGTKTKTRFRTIPIVLPEHRSLLEYALRYAEENGEFFAPWHNVNRVWQRPANGPASLGAPRTIYGERARHGCEPPGCLHTSSRQC